MFLVEMNGNHIFQIKGDFFYKLNSFKLEGDFFCRDLMEFDWYFFCSDPFLKGFLKQNLRRFLFFCVYEGESFCKINVISFINWTRLNEKEISFALGFKASARPQRRVSCLWQTLRNQAVCKYNSTGWIQPHWDNNGKLTWPWN